MLKIFLLFNLLFFAGDKSSGFDLKKDLAKDRRIIKSEHTDYNKEVVKSLRVFDSYANVSLAGAKFENRVIGKHTILKWTQSASPALCVYEVISVIPSDTIYQDNELVWDSLAQKNKTRPGKKIRLKRFNFIFHTYIIQPVGGNQLIYMTGQHQGLIEYRIGNKRFFPLYESIALGIKYPDLKEIFKLVAAVK
jgi:hypothetical protein